MPFLKEILQHVTHLDEYLSSTRNSSEGLLDGHLKLHEHINSSEVVGVVSGGVDEGLAEFIYVFSCAQVLFDLELGVGMRLCNGDGEVDDIFGGSSSGSNNSVGFGAADPGYHRLDARWHRAERFRRHEHRHHYRSRSGTEVLPIEEVIHADWRLRSASFA